MTRLVGFPAAIAVLCIAACSAAATSPAPATPGQTIPAASQPLPTASAMPDSSAQPTSDTPTPTPDATEPSASPSPPQASPTPQPGAVFDQPWATAALTNVTTGETFRIADLTASDKVVFVETMAIWCSNCRAQQAAAAAAFGNGLDPDRVEWVVIDVETSEAGEALARYRERNGFPFRYAISDASLSRSLVDSFGDVILNPPPVNVVVLGTDGRVTHLLGHHDAAGLAAIATEHGA